MKQSHLTRPRTLLGLIKIYAFRSLSTWQLLGTISAFIIWPLTAHGQTLYSQNFDLLTNGMTIVGQAGWALQSGTSSLAVVVSNPSTAYSSPNFLQLTGSAGTNTRVYQTLGTNLMTDSANNRFQFYFMPENPEDGTKTTANIFLIGHNGSASVDMIEVSIDFANDRIRLTTDAARGAFNTTINFSQALSPDSWYLFDALISPTSKTYTLSISDTNGISLMSGTFAFRDTTNSAPNRMYRMDFQNNNNGRLDWAFDNITVTSATNSLYWTANGSSLGGTGTWNTSGSNWSVSKDSVSGATWKSSKMAVFTNNAATVTVDAVTVENGILFATDGYTLNSGTITLGGAAISNNVIATTKDVMATVNSTLLGTAGLMKEGTGTLILGGNNSYSGGTVVSAGHLGGTTTSLQGAITNHAVVAFNQATNGTYSAAMSGSGSLEKAGSGTVTLSGSSANTFTGKTTVKEGTLLLNKTADTKAIKGEVEVKSNATLFLSASGQIKDSSEITLSGGTIKRGADVSEVMGNLTLTADSTLDYGTGATGTLQFGSYTPTPSSLLTVNSFLVGNKLVFGNDLTTFVTNSSYFSFDNAFTSSWSNNTFTITAIPEPSACIAAAGLIGLMLWPCRRRLLKGLASEASTDT